MYTFTTTRGTYLNVYAHDNGPARKAASILHAAMPESEAVR